MSTLVAQPERHSLVGRTWAALAAAWGIVVGVLPHVLHHVGPLAGAALLSAVGGASLFAAVGFVLTIPLLLRLHRRFRTWTAPAVALTLFAAMFAFSSLVIGPAITGGDNAANPTPEIERSGTHASHHSREAGKEP